MATSIIPGQTSWELNVDQDGFRTYTITHLVEGEYTDGPAVAYSTPGLPQPGDPWSFDGDSDPWCFCTRKTKVTRLGNPKGGKGKQFSVEQEFTNRSPRTSQDGRSGEGQGGEDPTLDPPKISVNFNKIQLNAAVDRFGVEINNSAHEHITGSQNDWDESNPVVRIEQNGYLHNLPLLVAFKDCLNDRELWGIPRRWIKVSSMSLDQKYLGRTQTYWTRTLEFEIKFGGHDRDVLDEATKVLQGRWGDDGTWELEVIGIYTDSSPIYPDYMNPSHFMRAVDRRNNPCKLILNGFGEPYNPDPLPLVMTCDQCPAGALEEWSLSGFFDPDSPIKAPTVLDSITLTHSSLCEWGAVATVVGTVGMYYDASSSRFMLTASAYTGIWAHLPTKTNLQADAWRCKGPNTFYRISGNGPNTLTIQAVRSSEPGKIHIEKYREGNLLLLGIPANF